MTIIHGMSNVVYDILKDMAIEYIVLGEPIHPHRRQRSHISIYMSSAKLSEGRVLYIQVEGKMLAVSIQDGGRSAILSEHRASVGS